MWFFAVSGEINMWAVAGILSFFIAIIVHLIEDDDLGS